MCVMFVVSHHFVFRIAAPVVYRHVNKNDSICRNVTLCVSMRSGQCTCAVLLIWNYM